MNGPDYTAEDARDRLDRAAQLDLAGAKDRRIYGLYLAATGIIIGAYVVVTRTVDGGSSSPLVLAGYVALLLAVTVWQSRAAGAVPRGAKRKGLFALLGTVVVLLVVIMALNVIEIELGLRWWYLAIGAVATALPCIVTGLSIARGAGR